MPAKAKAAPVVPPLFRAALKAAGLPIPVAEYRFHPTRKWRWDYAWTTPVYGPYNLGPMTYPNLALEVQGGLFVNGRHSRGAALLKEHEKLNEAAVLGWRVLFTTPSRLCHPDTIDMIRRALAQ